MIVFHFKTLLNTVQYFLNSQLVAFLNSFKTLQDRDITEKIALGVSGAGKAELYDQRLFNASSGLDSGEHIVFFTTSDYSIN